MERAGNVEDGEWAPRLWGGLSGTRHVNGSSGKRSIFMDRALGRHPGCKNRAGSAEIGGRACWFLSEMWARQGVVRLPRGVHLKRELWKPGRRHVSVVFGQ